ncbi:BaiN/RdsA family NAD(P)/FAD-dependent oxidoreductase [Oceanibaculum pacificum]|uniref:NAD(FAD)-utilizing dehydrogenase n=1 Tax=Oceanibaculum pacificum TaxID=580166 RepID=A0A154W270_9PROT|nr:NAD(P)/FAD-dependent oxidoreductase [Oceanibaculum pacificum]KZD07618.1 hypothetical protein AUP43_09935 [Oceanibaculum pacificum]
MAKTRETWDAVVVGAGAAGLFCAAQAGRRGRSVLVLDHARAPGEKIRISGGGRCNFTNLHATPANYLSQNPSFCISALRRYTQQDFIALVQRHGIAFHEKTLGQLFCDGPSTQIIDMLLGEMRAAGAELRLGVSVSAVERQGEGFDLTLSDGARLACASLIVASGGKSIPKMGATGWGYDLARRFGIAVTETRPALVPLTFEPQMLARLKPLSGVSVEAAVSSGKTTFQEGLLFTHRGLSGPSILQISSYWREGGEIAVRLLPGLDLYEALRAARAENGRQAPQTALAAHLPKRLAQLLAEEETSLAPAKTLADLSDKRLRRLAAAAQDWRVAPAGSEGYRTAEVTLGGIDTAELDSKTMQAKRVPGLFFIGEVVDVTGWLGGYNFQWAWSSGWVAGQVA